MTDWSDEAKARLERAYTLSSMEHVQVRKADIRAALGEIERLGVANHRQACEIQTYQEQNPEAATQGGYARERARAEAAETKVERLREALNDISVVQGKTLTGEMARAALRGGGE